MPPETRDWGSIISKACQSAGIPVRPLDFDDDAKEELCKVAADVLAKTVGKRWKLGDPFDDNPDIWEDPMENSFDRLPSIPKWRNRKDGYTPVAAYKVVDSLGDNADFTSYFIDPRIANNHDVDVVAVFYEKKDHRKHTCATLYAIERETRRPFPGMKYLWDEMRKDDTKWLSGMECVMDEDGAIHAVGDTFVDRRTNGPTKETLLEMAYKLLNLYYQWSQFPNEKDYASVKVLLDKKVKIRAFKDAMKSNRIQNAIDDHRKTIKEEQDAIRELERQLNEICEEAAEASNYLEERGYPPDCKIEDGEQENDE